MKTITIKAIPPHIVQYFDKLLLSHPKIKFHDDSNKLYQVYQYIKRKLQKKTYRCPIQDKKFIELEKTFLDLYASALEKEKNYKAKTGNDFGEPFYRFRETNRNHKWLFGRLRFKR